MLHEVESCDFGAGIVVERFSANGDDLINAAIRIAFDAEAGPRDVLVTAGGDSGRLESGFSVLDPARP